MALKQQNMQLLQERQEQIRMYEAYRAHTKRLPVGAIFATRAGKSHVT